MVRVYKSLVSTVRVGLLGAACLVGAANAVITDEVVVEYKQSVSVALSTSDIENQLKLLAFEKVGQIMRDVGKVEPSREQFKAHLLDLNITTKDGYIIAKGRFSFREKIDVKANDEITLPENFFNDEQTRTSIKETNKALLFDLNQKDFAAKTKKILENTIKFKKVESCENSKMSNSVEYLEDVYSRGLKKTSKFGVWGATTQKEAKELSLVNNYESILKLMLTGITNSTMPPATIQQLANPKINSKCAVLIFDYKNNGLFDSTESPVKAYHRGVKSVFVIVVKVNGVKYYRQLLTFTTEKDRLTLSSVMNYFPDSLRGSVGYLTGRNFDILYENRNYTDEEKIDLLEDMYIDEFYGPRENRHPMAGKVWITSGRYSRYELGFTIYAKNSIELKTVAYSIEEVPVSNPYR